MDALKQLKALEEIMTLSEGEALTSRRILSFIGDEKTYEKEVAELFPRFSWSGRRALRMALLVEEEGNKSARSQAARIELANDIQYLKDIELLAVLVVLKRGREKLGSLVDLAKATAGTAVLTG